MKQVSFKSILIKSWNKIYIRQTQVKRNYFGWKYNNSLSVQLLARSWSFCLLWWYEIKFLKYFIINSCTGCSITLLAVALIASIFRDNFLLDNNTCIKSPLFPSLESAVIFLKNRKLSLIWIGSLFVIFALSLCPARWAKRILNQRSGMNYLVNVVCPPVKFPWSF